MDWRKLILDFCRIQVPIFQNDTLSAGFYAIVRHDLDIVLPDSRVVSLSLPNFIPLLETIAFSPVLCSFLSYFVRAEHTHWRDEFLNQKDLSLDKEVRAALEYKTFDQVLDYSSIVRVCSNR
jgi:hypothetical protein